MMKRCLVVAVGSSCIDWNIEVRRRQCDDAAQGKLSSVMEGFNSTAFTTSDQKQGCEPCSSSFLGSLDAASATLNSHNFSIILDYTFVLSH